MSERSHIKLLVFIPEIGLGGAEWQTIYMLEGLNKTLIAPRLLTLNRGINERSLLPYYHINIEKNVGFDITFGGRLRKLLRVEAPDIVHLISSTAILWGIFTSRPPNKSRFICSLWGEDFGMSRLRKTLLRTALHFSDLITVNSYGLRKVVSRNYHILESRIDVLVNGVDTERFAPRDGLSFRRKIGIDKGDFVVGWVGNIRPEKDFGTLVKSAKAVLERYNNVRFLVVGGGIHFNDASDTIRKEGLRERFIFTNRVDDTAGYYNVMDVLVNTSISEGMCNVLLEAQASSLACVVTDAPGNSELVLNGITGFVVKRGDYNAIAEKIILLKENEILRCDMGVKGREYMLNSYALDKMVINYQNLYLRVCNRL
ncbi:MAG: glycosyltransferase [bacterium]